MAVITKFFIVRDGVELDKIFTDKKEAEGYDKMLDAADNLAGIIKQAELPEKLSADTIRQVAICLAKQAPEVTKILRGVKPVVAKPTTPAKPKGDTTPEQTKSETKQTTGASKKPGSKPKTGSKAK